jgi:hypothetical protein
VTELRSRSEPRAFSGGRGVTPLATGGPVEDTVRDLVPQYELLFKGTNEFMEENPGIQAEGILDIMDSFVRYSLNKLCLESF